MIALELLAEAAELPRLKEFEKPGTPLWIKRTAELGLGAKLFGTFYIASIAVSPIIWLSAHESRYPAIKEVTSILAEGAVLSYAVGILLYNGYAKNAARNYLRNNQTKQ